jgi:Family of unknown function (DUF5684)
MAFFTLTWLAAVILVIVGVWKVFEKAGQPGWASLIPFYNFYILLKIAGRPGWWLVLLFIPIVGIVIAAIVAIDVAKSFGRSGAFGFFLLFLLGAIGYMMLGFGEARYLGPAAYRPSVGPGMGPYAPGQSPYGQQPAAYPQGQPAYGQGQAPYAQAAAPAQSPGPTLAPAAGASQQPPAGTQPTHRFCAKCGTQLAPGARFCPCCGGAA